MENGKGREIDIEKERERKGKRDMEEGVPKG